MHAASLSYSTIIRNMYVPARTTEATRMKNKMSEPKEKSKGAWLSEAKTVFLAMIAEVDMTVLNVMRHAG